MPSLLFYLFAFITLFFGVGVIVAKNPVASALSLVLSFVGVAALFISLDAYFIGTLQILVYAGAVMVLFLFIIMLLDLKEGPKRKNPVGPIAAAIMLVAGFMIQLIGVLSRSPDVASPAMNTATLANAASAFPQGGKIQLALMNGKLPDVHLIGRLLFTEYNFPLQILGVLLLVATVGVVVLSKRQAE